MQELKEIEASGVVHFENQGVSRSNNRLFICVITFTSLHELITDLCAQSFPSTEALDRVISGSHFHFNRDIEDNCICYFDDKKRVEILASYLENGGVEVMRDDIEAITNFKVFLKI